MDKKQNDIDNLIALWLSGNLSETEKEQFELWMNADQKNIVEITKLKTIWDLTGNLETPIGDNFELRWQRIADATAVRTSIPLFYKIAASVTILAIVSTMAIFWVQGGNVAINTKNSILKTVMLPDSSSVTLNSASSIRYNHRLWFLGRKVHVEGEAFFSVKKNGATFVVATPMAYVKVLGTSFNIKQRNKAVHVSCVSGNVGVTLHGNQDHYIVLEKGTKCEMRNSNVIKTAVTAANLEIAWMEKKLAFSHTPLPEVFDEISRFYNVTLDYSGKSNATVSGTFENASMEEVLKTVCLSAGLSYSKENSIDYKISD